MLSRICFVVLCVATSRASAIVVSEGDYYERLVAPARLDMTGGVIAGELIMGGSSDDADWPWTFNISGGTIGEHIAANRDLRLRGGYLNISGGRILDELAIDSPGSHLTFTGWYFEHLNFDRPNYNVHLVRGWLADGSWLELGTQNEYEHRSDIWPLNFVIVPNDGLAGDANGDWLVDITDLNLVRNNFGSAGAGDVDGDGTVGIADLNDVRNNFGLGGPFFDHSDPRVTIHSQSTVVPEPASWLLMALGGVALAGTASRCRCRYRPRRFP